MRDFWEFLRFFFAFVVVIGVFGAAMICFAMLTASMECSAFGRSTGLPVKFDWDCYAQVEGKWIPASKAFAKPIAVEIK